MINSNLERLKELIRRRWPTLQEGLLLAALMAVATLVAFEFDIFADPDGWRSAEHVIQTDEISALAALLCVGLLVMCWRFLRLQQQELRRRLAAEGEARTLALEDPLTGLAN